VMGWSGLEVVKGWNGLEVVKGWNGLEVVKGWGEWFGGCEGLGWSEDCEGVLVWRL
jgi:hypothetical protein